MDGTRGSHDSQDTTDGSQDEKRLLVIDERDDEVEDSDTNQTKCVAKVRRDEVSDSAS